MNTKLTLLALSIATSLAACGGGGGDSGGTVTPVVNNPVVQIPVVSNPVITTDKSLQTTVPAYTYAVGSQELAAITLLNERRLKCGFGMLKQNAQLDKAAAAHAAYVSQPVQGVYEHNEVRGLADAYFTGVTPADRAIFQGYSPANKTFVDEEFLGEVSNSAGFVNSGLGYGAYGATKLMQAPFHLIGMLRPNREAGVAFSSVFRSSLIGSFNALVFKASTSTETQEPSGVQTYPCDGSVIPTSFDGNESPQPFPGRNFVNNPMGTPIAVMAPTGTTLKITTVALNKTGVAQALAVNILTSTTSPNSIKANESAILADAKLDTNSSYTLVLTGTLDGVAYTKTINFSTGAN
jgi:uncharacterized protein YkwD